MIVIRRAAERRHVKNGKKESWLTFFPGEPPGPLAGAFGLLTAFDEFRLPPNEAAAPRPTGDAEVVVYVYRGALAQEDSNGGSGVVRAGEFQCLTTGSSVRHVETNTSWTDWAHVFRISLLASEVGLECAHEQRRFAAAQRRNALCVVASRDGRKGSLRLRQEALVCSSILDPGHHLVHELKPRHSAWLHLIHGEAQFGDLVLTAGDGAGTTDEPAVSLTVQEKSEILLIDLGPTSGPTGSS
jgi:redox-sensitive bicupin YhaK (pirin superfamily)